MRTLLQRRLLVFALALSFVAAPGPASLKTNAAPPQRQGTAARPARPAPSPTPQASAARTASKPLAEPVPVVNKVLANGLEVIVLEDHAVPLVTVEMAVRNGSFTEPPELNGLSHLYEHMFLLAANRAHLNGEDYLKTINQIGLVSNAETREEIVNYYYTTTSPNLSTAMRLMRDSARFPLFHPQQLEREREAVIAELDRHESNPYLVISKEMTNRLFYKYPSRKSPGGSKETVRAATTDMMRLIQSRYYVPNNSAIVVTGDTTPAEVFRLVEELFGDWERAEDPFKKFPLVEHPPLPKSEGAVLTGPINNVVIMIGWHGPSIGKDDAGTYAADVFSYILGQPDSRFQRALVDTGLVTAVGIGYYTQRNVGPIQIMAQTTPDKARAALKAIHEEVARFNDPGYFTDQQLESAKALLEASDLYDREKLSDYSHTISFWWSSTGLDYFRGYLPRLRATSRADISRYVTTYVQGKPHVSLALMSDDAARTSGVTPDDLVGPRAAAAGTASR